MARKRHQNNRHSVRRERRELLSERGYSPRVLLRGLFFRYNRTVIYTLVTVLLVLLLWFVMAWAKKTYILGDRFHLTEIIITPVPHEESLLTYSNLPGVSGLESGVNILSYDLNEIETKLESFPETQSVKLSRRYPGTIIVELQERTPIAQLKYNGEHYLVDAEGVCFPSSLAPDTLWDRMPCIEPLYVHDMPMHKETRKLNDIGLQRALSLVATWEKYSPPVRLLSIKVNSYHSLLALTDTETELNFGYYEHERQIRDFHSILAHCQLNNLTVQKANLLPFKNIPVVFAEKPVVRPMPSQKVRPDNNPTFSPQEDILMILEQG